LGEKNNKELSIFGLGEKDSGLISQIFLTFNFQLLKIDLNLRPQNLDFDTYYQLTCAYENLRS